MFKDKDMARMWTQLMSEVWEKNYQAFTTSMSAWLNFWTMLHHQWLENIRGMYTPFEKPLA